MIDLLVISRLVLLGLPIADRRQAGFQRKGQFINLLRFFLRISRSLQQLLEQRALRRLFPFPNSRQLCIFVRIPQGKLRCVNIDGVVPAIFKIRHYRDAHGCAGHFILVVHQIIRQILQGFDILNILNQRLHRLHAQRIARFHIQIGVIELLRQLRFRTGLRGISQKGEDFFLYLFRTFRKRRNLHRSSRHVHAREPVLVDCHMKIVRFLHRGLAVTFPAISATIQSLDASADGVCSGVAVSWGFVPQAETKNNTMARSNANAFFIFVSFLLYYFTFTVLLYYIYDSFGKTAHLLSLKRK